MPRTIEVGPHKYKVRLVKKLKELGQCNYDTAIMSLQHGMVRSKNQEVLVHELLHALGYPSLCGKDEEFVDTIAPALLQVLQQNPKLVDYLTGQ